jgi:hypothetical protein
MWKGILVATFATLFVTAAPAAASTYTVSGTADIAGSCVGTACSSVRAALAAAAGNPGEDVVQLGDGTYQLETGPLALTGAVTLRGTSARRTEIVGAQSARVVEIADATAVVDHLTLTGGEATPATDYFGGTLTANTSTVLLDHVRVRNGQAYSGGGIANRNGAMTIRNSLIDHNQALFGGGDGGAIINFGGNGGAAASLVMKDTTVAFNSANLAGGIISRGNTANTLAFESVTLAYNNANSVGGVHVPAADGGAFTTRGSILAQNFASGGANCDAPAMVSNGANVEDGTTCDHDGPGDRGDASSSLIDTLSDEGGETDVVRFYSDSAARDIGGTCSATDQTDLPRPAGAGCDAGAWEYRSVTITAGPRGATNDRNPRFEFSGVGPYSCALEPEDSDAGDCDSPVTRGPLADGTYTFRVFGEDGTTDSRTFTVDTVAPAAPAVRPNGDQYAFEGESGATLQCSLNGAAFTACSSPYSTAGFAPGDYALDVRAVDAAGNAGPAARQTFSVASQQPVQTPVPTPAPTATPAPPLEPVRNQSVAAEPEGKVLIKRNGKFVPLKDEVVKNGSEIDAKNGEVKITTSTGEVAVFYDGRFKVSQRGGLTTLTLSEPLDCKPAPGKASAAAKKPKTRKLWGDGKGRFKTKGQYSAATVRGTKWLVQDTCTSTLTRVAQGVVSVRDEVKNKTIVLRKGKSYTARAKKK